jgi:vacuolar protein sorting-associated protein 13A/C
MSNVKLSLTQRQYTLLMSVLESLPGALSGIGEVDESVTPTVSTPSTPSEDVTYDSVNLEPELAVVKKDSATPELWTSLDFAFSVQSIALELYNNEAITEWDLKNQSIARFALVKTHLGVNILSDTAMEAEFSLKTISFSNTRSGNSVFRDLIPAATHEGNQVYVWTS